MASKWGDSASSSTFSFRFATPIAIFALFSLGEESKRRWTIIHQIFYQLAKVMIWTKKPKEKAPKAKKKKKKKNQNINKKQKLKIKN